MDEWLNRAEISTFLTPKEYSTQLQSMGQKEFKVEYAKDQQILKYNGLKDKYLKSYFQNGIMKNHLVKIGLILPDGSPKDKLFEFKKHWINQFDEDKEKLKKEGEKGVKPRRNYCRSSLGDNKNYYEETESYRLPPLNLQVSLALNIIFQKPIFLLLKMRSQTPKLERPIIYKKGIAQNKLRLNTEEEQLNPQGQQQQQSQQYDMQQDKNGRYFKSENSDLEGLKHIQQRQTHIKQYLNKPNRVNQSFDTSTNTKSSQRNLNMNDSYIQSQNNHPLKDKSPIFDSQLIEVKLTNKQISQYNGNSSNNSNRRQVPPSLNTTSSHMNNMTPMRSQQILFEQESSNGQPKNMNSNATSPYNFYGNDNSNNVSPNNRIIPNNRYGNKSTSKTPKRSSQNQTIREMIQDNDFKQGKASSKQGLSTKSKDSQFTFNQTDIQLQNPRAKNFQTDITANRQSTKNGNDRRSSEFAEVVPAMLSKPQPPGGSGNKQHATKLHMQHMSDLPHIQSKNRDTNSPFSPTQQRFLQNNNDQAPENIAPQKQTVQFIIQQINTIEYTPNNESKEILIGKQKMQSPNFVVVATEKKIENLTKFQEYKQGSKNTSPKQSIYQQAITDENNQNVNDQLGLMQQQHLQQMQIQQESSKNIIQQSDALQKMIQQQKNKAQQRNIITQKLVLPESISVDIQDELTRQQNQQIKTSKK